MAASQLVCLALDAAKAVVQNVLNTLPKNRKPTLKTEGGIYLYLSFSRYFGIFKLFSKIMELNYFG